MTSSPINISAQASETSSRKRRVQFAEYVECRSVKPRTCGPDASADEQLSQDVSSHVFDEERHIADGANDSEDESERGAEAETEVVAMKTRDGPSVHALVTQLLVLKLIADRKIVRSCVRAILCHSASIQAGCRPATDEQIAGLSMLVELRLNRLIDNINVFGRASLMPCQRVLEGNMLPGLRFLHETVAHVAQHPSMPTAAQEAPSGAASSRAAAAASCCAAAARDVFLSSPACRAVAAG
mmetsp:Transcript_55690/g.147091  ORF Transcript_55690/g.147091 Transcript_55690/m.147091 type:complete len:241 (+) Transcript_55690:37-759(+)